MKKVTKIQVEDQKTKLRVAAYCRVSSGSEEQLASLEIQKSHYEALIKGNPGWELAGVYADEGISGTKLRKREAMLRMLKDCGQHKIDLILTKSISRFARNTTDCLEMVRKLKDQGIYVQFESENIHTETMDSELILSILGGLAEGEAKSISLNSKWSMKRRFETGAFKHTSAPYGYDYKDGGLIPNAEEAVIVERIFREYLAGQGTPKIADGLNGDAIPSRKGRAWSSTVVRKILSNEACTGDVLLQKTYTDDQYNRHYNQGQRTQYLVGNHHEAIISQEVFDAAQTLLCRRGKGEGASGKYHQRYPLSGKMKCAHCGSTFKRRIQRSRTGPYIIWACTCHLQDKTLCPVKPVREEAIEAAFVTLINKLIFGHKAVLKPLLQKLRSMNQTKHQERFQALEQQMAENQKQRNTLVELLGKCIIEKPIYNQESSRLLREAEHLKTKRQTLAKALLNGVSYPLEVEQLLKFAEKAEPREGFKEDLLERFVEGIVIHSTTELACHLRCGLVLNERMVK